MHSDTVSSPPLKEEEANIFQNSNFCKDMGGHASMGGHPLKFVHGGLIGKYKFIISSDHFLHLKNSHNAFSLYCGLPFYSAASFDEQ